MKFFMRFEVHTKNHNIDVMSYTILKDFLKRSGIKEDICTDMDSFTEVFDSNGEFLCSYKRIFNYFVVESTSWYEDSLEEYEYDGVDCEREIKYIKTDYNIGNLISKYFPSDVTPSPFPSNVTPSPFENSRVDIRVSNQDSPDGLVYENCYFRKTEVYKHLNYTPKDHMSLVASFTLEITKQEYDSSIVWEYKGKKE